MTTTDDLKENYLIAWKSRITGVTGLGTRMYSKNVATVICTGDNLLDPDVFHWPEKVASK